MKTNTTGRTENGTAPPELSDRRNFLKVGGAAIVAASAFPAVASAHDDDNDDSNRPVSVPLSCTGLIFGKSIRTIFSNRGTHRISLQASVFDANGTVVKHTTLVLEPGQMRAFEVSRQEVVRDESSVLLRTEVTLRRGDAQNLGLTGELVDDNTGDSQPLVVIGAIAILIGLLVPVVHAARS